MDRRALAENLDKPSTPLAGAVSNLSSEIGK
jgi:hypothetical protein